MTTPPSPSADDRARIYNGRYELIRQIARGGTAQVYLARDLLLDRPVALKVLFPELSSDSSFVERFRREAQAAANLSHPNIVPVFDWGESERTYFIVMEYVDGEPLSAIIRSQAPLPPARAAGIAADISKALSYAHRHGVVHRDVKPGNVLITRDGQVKVTDFGIARAIGADDNVTQTGLVMGTATYFSPEQAQGLGVDGRSDVYALGVVLYEMVTGRPPFSADTPVAIAYKHVSEAAVPPSELEPRVPLPLEAIIMRAIAKQPSDRYATAEDLHSDLQRYAQGSPVMAMSSLAGAPTVVGATQMLAPLGATQAVVASPTTVLPVGAPLPGGEVAASGADAAASPPRGPEMPKRRWVGWTLAGILLAAALAFLVYAGGRQLGYFGASGYFAMPDEVGRQVFPAAGELLGDGLKVHSKAVYSTRAAKGIVLSESPPVRTMVQRGTTVTLVYSLGPRKVGVPAVVGESLSAADNQLRAAGLTPVPVAVPTVFGATVDSVTRTDPAEGTRVVPGTKVKVYYYSGKTVVKVPNVAGDTLAQADAAITSSGLTLNPVSYGPSTKYPKGTVIGTSPAAGTSEPEGTGVSVIISQGPPVAVPNVLGEPIGQAERRLTAAGLNYTVSYQQGAQNLANYVVGESPSQGTLVGPGTTVTLDVVQPSTSTTTTTSTTPPKKHKK